MGAQKNRRFHNEMQTSVSVWFWISNIILFFNEEAWDVEELKKLIYAGKMTDGKTIAGIMAYAEKYCR